MKLAILRADTVLPHLADRFGQYSDMLMRLLGEVEPGLRFTVFDVERQQYPTDLHCADAYLITGSKAAAYDDLPWVRRLQHKVCALADADIPTVGVCFGHQLLAQALGGRVERSTRGWGVGVHSAQWYARPAWLETPTPQLRLIVSHQDQVVAMPPGGRVLAGSTFCPHAACQFSDRLLGFQGHPEFLPGYAASLLAHRRLVLGESLYRSALSSLTQVTDSNAIARSLLTFVRSTRG